MKQRIIIKNFGPIKDVDLEINDFMVFIGPQASGKSTIAKLVYFFRNIGEFIVDNLLENIDSQPNERYTTSSIFLKSFLQIDKVFEQFALYFNEDSTIEYFFTKGIFLKYVYDQSSNNKVSVENLDSGEFKFAFFKMEQLTEFHEFNRINGDNINLSLDFSKRKGRFEKDAREYIKKFLSFNAGFTNAYLLDNRNASLLKRETYSLKNYFEILFNNLTNDLRYYFSAISFRQNEVKLKLNVALLSNLILGGKYEFDDSRTDILNIGAGAKLSLRLASSGQKEAVWIIQYIQRALIEKSSAFTIIEEPEAHLFPAAQKSLTELIALLANSAENQVMLTTHSPYILAAINNLMQAYKTGQTHPEATNEIINKELWLDPKRVSAYFVGGESNKGGIEDILDRELNSIPVEKIDQIAEVFNSDYDKLTDLEYNVVS